MAWYVYILRCSDGSLYTGITTDVDRRFAAHQQGRGGAYTRSRPPTQILYRRQLPSRSAALVREAQIKALSRAQKLALISQ